MPFIARAWSLTSLSTAFQSPDSSHPSETRDVDSSLPGPGRSLAGGERERARPLRFDRIAPEKISFTTPPSPPLPTRRDRSPVTQQPP
jgi:hypothetical protein